MVRQSFMRGRRRKVLVVATIILAASLITALMNLSIGVGDKMAKEMKSYGANITVVPNSESISLDIDGVDFNPLKDRVFLEEADLPKIKEIFWHNNVIGFAPFLKVAAEIAGADGPISLLGTRFDLPLSLSEDEEFRVGVKAINPFWQVRGRWPEDKDPAGVLAGAELARRLHLDVGSRIALRMPGRARLTTVTVKGILQTGGLEESFLVAPLPLVQELAALPGKVQSVSVSALTVPEDRLSRRTRGGSDALDALEYDLWYCTAYVTSIAHQIEEAIPNSTVRPIWQVAASEGTVINKLQLLMLVVTVAVFIASGLGISSLMITTIMERSREIGLMKALGASEAEVHLLFLAESVIVGGIGGLLGCAGGAVLSQVIGLSIFGSTVAFNFIAIPVSVAVSVLIALAGSLLPSRLISRLHPAEVLHGRR
jgi:putative ABC transport system permease protein